MDKVLLFLIVLALSTKYTYAYIDPGTGSYILQIILAGVFGGLFTLKGMRKNITDSIKRFFSRMPPKNNDVGDK